MNLKTRDGIERSGLHGTRLVAVARERPEKFRLKPFSKGLQSPGTESLVAPRRERNPQSPPAARSEKLQT